MICAVQCSGRVDENAASWSSCNVQTGRGEWGTLVHGVEWTLASHCFIRVSIYLCCHLEVYFLFMQEYRKQEVSNCKIERIKQNILILGIPAKY